MRSFAVNIVQATTEGHVRVAAPLFDEYRFLFARWVARESVLFLAFDEQNECIAFVHLYPLFLSDRMLRFWVLNDLYVKPDARRSGIARALMQRAEQYASETGSAGLTLSTAVKNVQAQRLYESVGYVRDSEFLYYNRFLDPGMTNSRRPFLLASIHRICD